MQILTFPSLSLKMSASPPALPRWPRSKWGMICTTVHLICVLKCTLKKVHEKHGTADNVSACVCVWRVCAVLLMLRLWTSLLLERGNFCLSLPCQVKYSIAKEISECCCMCLDRGVHMEAISKPAARAHALKTSLLFLVVCQEAQCFFCQTSEQQLLSKWCAVIRLLRSWLAPPSILWLQAAIEICGSPKCSIKIREEK